RLTGGTTQRMEFGRSAADALAVTDDGRFVAAGGSSGALRLWDGPAGDWWGHRVATGGRISALAFNSMDWLAMGRRDGGMGRWEPGSGRFAVLGKLPGAVTAIAMDRHGVVVAGDDDGHVFRWPVAVGTHAPTSVGAVAAGDGWVVSAASGLVR